MICCLCKKPVDNKDIVEMTINTGEGFASDMNREQRNKHLKRLRMHADCHKNIVEKYVNASITERERIEKELRELARGIK